MTHRSDTEDLEYRLMRERPVPSATFRGELGRKLVAARGGHTPAARVRVAIAACAGSGAFLMATAAIGVLGVGPLAG
jgi:hypothetical protein